MRRIRLDKLPGDGLAQASVYDPEFLREQARWIRDELDPQVARDGPDALHSDEILTLDEILRRLLTSNLHVEDMRYSRIHLAICDVAGRATRWPKRLVDRCDALKEVWEAHYGPLKALGTLLYEPGGRLHGVCTADDLSNEKLMIKWIKAPDVRLNPLKARRTGDLGFKPGDWWINPLFAYRDGMLDSSEAHGIVADGDRAYAVLLAEGDEVASTTPGEFTYRARSNDRGRYRLTAGTPDTRQPVRILRSHTLHSLWTPKAGIRYDGLHKVSGWSIKTDAATGKIIYDISFKRLPTEMSMDTVLCRPWTEELEDYKEFKRLRDLAKERKARKSVAKRADGLPTFTVSTDGAVEVFEDESAETPFQASFTDRLPDEILASSSKRPVMKEVAPRMKKDSVAQIPQHD